ncbi:MAG: beta-lactamase family protein [Planctomycetes bacterium]|nr:beta-lactamase family protein [Planctomycetota bacterium]
MAKEKGQILEEIQPLLSRKNHFVRNNVVRSLFSCSSIFFVIIIAITPCSSKGNTLIGDPKPLRQQLQGIRDKHQLPALAVSVVIGNRIIVASAVGQRKWGENISVTRNDAFELGSITKLITGTLIGVLSDQGKIGWRTTIGDVFPELFPGHETVYQNIAVYQLMTHTSGLSRHPQIKESSIDELAGSIIEKRLAYVSASLSEKPEARPGSKYIYSGGAIIAASMAERRTGKSWEELVTENVFKKLGMTTAGFGPMATPPDKLDAPWFHQFRDGKITPLAPQGWKDILYGNPAGRSVHCSVIDLGKFAAFHICGLQRRTHSTNLLKAKTLGQLYKVINIIPKKTKGKLYTAGGWRVQPASWAKNNLVYWHAGQSIGRGYAIVNIVPKLNYAICVMTNIGGDNAVKAAEEIRLILVKQLDNSEYKPNLLFQ